MSPRRRPVDPDLHSLLGSWELSLRAARKAPQTIKSYLTGVRLFLRHCESESLPPRLDRPTVNGFLAARLELGQAPKTVHERQLALRRFSSWLLEEGEIEIDQLIGLKSIKLDKKITVRLTEEECSRLISVCRGSSFLDRRDGAIIRLMLESVVRAGEVVAMTVTDVDLSTGVATVRRGKGNKGRLVPFGPKTAQAMDRYLRARRTHSLAHLPELWLGDRGRSLTYAGLYQALRRRSIEAGLTEFHPHLTRHTAAQRWLSAGGSEQGLMAVAGWESRAMLDRYTRASASNRAIEESRKLNLGELD